MKGLFEEINTPTNLRTKFVEPPFSVLSSRNGEWQKRKIKWNTLGIKSEIGRDVSCNPAFASDIDENGLNKYGRKPITTVSIFDPALAELMYNWFCPVNGTILDPFAGGSVRGIVANYLGFKYTGIDIRQEQIDSNFEQAKNIIPSNIPDWICGDSNKVLNTIDNKFDMFFTCPPYADLEVYSDLEGDISNMNYENFLINYNNIIKKSCRLLKNGSYAVIVVGEIRDKQGNYRGFVPDTIKAFTDAGMKYYNEVIFLMPLGTAMLRANRVFGSNKKLIKVHQNILMFRKS